MFMAQRVLILNTLAFFVCFAAWVLFGVLITFLKKSGLVSWDQTQTGWLLGLPILTGSLLRLPVGALADRFGGRTVFPLLMFVSAGAMWGLSFVHETIGFVIGGLGIGLAGASFAVGVAHTSRWFDRSRQGTALGIFGIGNSGAAVTGLVAPILLDRLTMQGQHPEGWRQLPLIYAAVLVVMAILFYVGLGPDLGRAPGRSSAPLKNLRVWRFGLYYFCFFGGFVALSQWLVPYSVQVFGVPLKEAGLIAAIFSFPVGLVRALGGWSADRWGARPVLYGVLIGALFCSLVLGVFGTNRVFFIPFVFILGMLMGIGMGAVYQHIPHYFPQEVGSVGGLIGVIGGLGGFLLPTLFGWLLDRTGHWTSCWFVLSCLLGGSLFWMHRVVRRLTRLSRLESQYG